MIGDGRRMFAVVMALPFWVAFRVVVVVDVVTFHTSFSLVDAARGFIRVRSVPNRSPHHRTAAIID